MNGTSERTKAVAETLYRAGTSTKMLKGPTIRDSKFASPKKSSMLAGSNCEDALWDSPKKEFMIGK
jgi:hypothetical protein